MPRHSTWPTLYDDCKTINIRFLKKNGFLKDGIFRGAQMTWSRNGEKTGSISFTINTLLPNSYLELDYKYQNEENINYQVRLVSIPSNLGKGAIWYFLCPATGKRCRKLYLNQGYFLHRKAFKGCFYEKQLYSHKSRNLCRTFDKYFGSDKAYETIYSKYFKMHYKGKPTKRYLKLLQIISISDQMKPSEVEKLF